MTTLRTLDGLSLAGKRVLTRVDLNVPIKDGKVADATRIERVLPTLHELIDHGAKIILLAHFGRPKGRPVAEMSLEPVAKSLSRLLGIQVSFAPDCVGDNADRAVAAMNDGDVLLLENTRFHEGEETNDREFSIDLARNGDIFVNDAFSAAHRAHASTVGIARLLPSYAGRAMQAEIEALQSGLENPDRPVTAIVGGAKVSTKIDLLENLTEKVDNLVIGGGMANTFLHATGIAIGKSLCEPDLADTAQRIIGAAFASDCRILLPIDAVIANEFTANAENQTVSIDAVPTDAMILDVGPKSIAAVNSVLGASKTIVWNGPLGAFEIPPFDQATVATAKVAADLTMAEKLYSVAGGGDTVAALNHAGVTEQFSYVSTAGGAFLEWLEGKDLPGIAVLSEPGKP